MLTCPEKLVFAFYGWIIPVSFLLRPLDPGNVFLFKFTALLDRRDICPDPASDLKILRFMHERVGSVNFLVIPLASGISLTFFLFSLACSFFACFSFDAQCICCFVEQNNDIAQPVFNHVRFTVTEAFFLAYRERQLSVIHMIIFSDIRL